MKKAVSIIPLFILILLASCTKTEIAFGTSYVDNENTQIIKVDTFSATLSSVYVDSFATTGTGVALLGMYSDPLFGKTTSQTYFEIAPPNYEDIYQYTLYDSITLIGKLNHTYYGDSTQPVQLSVYPLTANIELDANTTSLYNTSRFPQSSIALGNSSMLIQPTADDTIAIRLNDAMGQELLGMLQRKSDTITNATLFRDYYKGFTIVSSGTTAMLLGVNDSLTIRLHYKKQGLFLESKTLDLTIGSTNRTFNHIETDRTGTPLASLGPSNKEILAGAASNTAYSQYLSSVMAKIQFTSIRELLKAPGYKKLLRASLIIRPIESSYNFYTLPSSLRLTQTDVLNGLNGDLYATASDGSTAVQTGNLVTDYLYGKDSYYTYDVTAYINNLLTTNNYLYSGLLLLQPSGTMKTTANRVVIGNRLNAAGKIELQLYYATVQ